MNYRHSFHAGNFADVFKHSILTLLVQSFFRKETPFCYFDTHSGSGIYDLQNTNTQKSKEFESGIAKVLDVKEIETYLNIVKKLNPSNTLKYYPGSPEIVYHLLRPQDRMLLCELHPEEYSTLKKHFSHQKKSQQIHMHHQDGYQSLKAFLPPKEKRGLILIDPPFENANEFEKILEWIPEALKKFEMGVYAIWYPIKDRAPIDYFLRSMKTKIKRPLFVAELEIFETHLPTHLNGCGMLIINPPWQIEEAIQQILPILSKRLKVSLR